MQDCASANAHRVGPTEVTSNDLVIHDDHDGLGHNPNLQHADSSDSPRHGQLAIACALVRHPPAVLESQSARACCTRAS